MAGPDSGVKKGREGSFIIYEQNGVAKTPYANPLDSAFDGGDFRVKGRPCGAPVIDVEPVVAMVAGERERTFG